MDVLYDKTDVQRWIRDAHANSDTTCLVPTMGGLHEGHLNLVRLARTIAEKVIVSIYVNPTQFAPGEDFHQYPRTLERDLDLLRQRGDCDVVYAPSVMYHRDHATMIVPTGAAEGLESEFRAHFFSGVATIVTKLFHHAPTTFAVFGQKDYQQLEVIRQLVRDLDLDVVVHSGPTVRAPSGLALSSRNQYLSQREAAQAGNLYKTLLSSAQSLRDGDPIERVLTSAKNRLQANGFDKVDYFELRQGAGLGAVTTPEGSDRLLAAAWMGTTRLIDNISLSDTEEIIP